MSRRPTWVNGRMTKDVASESVKDLTVSSMKESGTTTGSMDTESQPSRTGPGKRVNTRTTSSSPPTRRNTFSSSGQPSSERE